MKAPIKYFGGKGLLFKRIIEQFSKDSNIDTYIEPFGGSYSVGLNVDYPVRIYNDLEQNVYSLYKVLSDPKLFFEFKERCDLFPYSEDFRKEFKEKLKGGDLDIIERAFCFFYVNRTSHNGIGGISINTVIRRNMSKSISDFLSCVDRLPELHQKLSKVIVLNTDGVELIKKYDRKNVLFYLDPPYEHSTRTSARYKMDMNEEKHKELLDVLMNIEYAEFVLSGYDCELYSYLEKKGINKINLKVNTVDGSRNPKTKIETLWKNF